VDIKNCFSMCWTECFVSNISRHCCTNANPATISCVQVRSCVREEHLFPKTAWSERRTYLRPLRHDIVAAAELANHVIECVVLENSTILDYILVDTTPTLKLFTATAS
jgi:hypothetical protein